MAFNSKYPYMRLIDDTSRHNKGTQTIQTSGDLSSVDITGEAILCQDYPTHSYHVIPLSSTTAEFSVQGSNDNENWTDLTGCSFTTSTTGAFVEGNWYAAYLRPVAEGSAGNLLINEVHRV
tara:strand:+ start:207 stop:569 length:363 start_codon:yes stop_codon:yes gene_type:complete